jgi:hypothetical protein
MAVATGAVGEVPTESGLRKRALAKRQREALNDSPFSSPAYQLARTCVTTDMGSTSRTLYRDLQAVASQHAATKPGPGKGIPVAPFGRLKTRQVETKRRVESRKKQERNAAFKEPHSKPYFRQTSLLARAQSCARRCAAIAPEMRWGPTQAK